jgi:hypothetical protein
MQALHDLPLDLSSSLIGRASLCSVLCLPAPFVKLWLLGCHPIKLDISDSELTDHAFLSLVSELPSAPRMTHLGLNLATDTLSSSGSSPWGKCSFLKEALVHSFLKEEMVQDDMAPCDLCKCHCSPSECPDAKSPVADCAVEHLSRATHRLPSLTRLSPLCILLTVRNLHWLEHLFVGAPQLTRVDMHVHASENRPTTHCCALLFLQKFMMLPALKELRIEAFPGGILGCMLECFGVHPSLEKVMFKRSSVTGKIPPSVKNIVQFF